MSQSKVEDPHKYDYLLIITIAALLIVGLMMIYSAALGYQLYNGKHYFTRQAPLDGVGLLLCLPSPGLSTTPGGASPSL
ncbi:MAG: hypothetical protein U0401_04380 [Anaerolineae bacterium]